MTNNRKTLPLRLEPDVYAALSHLSQLKKRSMNDLVTGSVEKLIRAQSEETIADMEATIRQLKTYLGRDPDFKTAKKRFVDAEIANEDPAEGRVVSRSRSVLNEVKDLLSDA